MLIWVITKGKNQEILRGRISIQVWIRYIGGTIGLFRIRYIGGTIGLFRILIAYASYLLKVVIK